MIVYEATKDIFCEDVINDVIETKIYERFKERIGHRTTISEIRSWKNSMEYMYKVLNDINIPNNIGIAIEFKIPYTSKRVDFMISGINKEEKNTVIIVELKQWESVEIVEGKDALVRTFLGNGMREPVHPSYQAWTYAAFIEDYNENVQKEKVVLHPCAYLHNYINVTPPTLLSNIYSEHIEKAPVFIKGDVLKLREFINRNIKYGDNKETLFMIEHGKIRPSKSLQDALTNMLKGNEEFIMLDDQKEVYEYSVSMARESYKDGKKRVLIVEGGPGTGKSVIAINLLANLTNEDMVSIYVSKNAAPRRVYATKLTGTFKKTRIDNLFKGSGSFYQSEFNEFDVLIADEAHRLNEKSGFYGTQGENQIKEIINASKFSIFFIDETQRIHIDDIGSINEIIKHAEEFNAEYKVMQLNSQFRCNGSDGYIAWVEDLLEIKETANYNGFELDYDIEVFDNPNDLKEKIFELNVKTNNKARLLAGYCWEWNTKTRNRSDVFDIEIAEYNFGMSWNLNNTSTWAIDPESVNEVGCIHTSQGLEFDYVGVIIGLDLRYENDRIITDYEKRAKSDQSLKGIKKIYEEDPEKAFNIADEIIKNTYKTLLTRGQKGCYIYCEDKNLANYIKKRISLFK